MKANQLTARKAATAKPDKGKRRAYILDGGGLFLQVTAKDGTEFHRSWVFRYSSPIYKNDKGQGRVREMGLGPLETFTLKEARDRARDCRQQVADGLDPIEVRNAERAKNEAEAAKRITFAEATARYLAAHEKSWRNPKHRQQWRSTLETYAFPVMGRLFVDEIELAHVLRILEPIWQTKTETASRLRGRIERVLSWATVGGFRKGDNPARWTGHLSEVLPSKHLIAIVKHHKALPYDKLPAFMEALRASPYVSAKALEFTILTAARTDQATGCRWDELDLDNSVWTLSAERMKAKREHRVPLCERAIAILKDLPRDTSGFVFPGGRAGRPISNAAMDQFLKGMGYGPDVATVHGFRSTFKDWASERTSYPNEVSEAALAHVIKDKTEAAYRRGDLFEKRRRLMNEWGRYCESTPAKGEVVSIRGKQA